ncbi:MAG: carbohydrate-binding domain-containing protein [Muribaculaceae bacterium]|nr:carbohydrate-binding domain-containing protein [Muribaculaceae bacterium]MBR1550742.1 carbohydrate-binding domain-containing protein [Muribaculaceae bacterium]
MKSVIKHIIIAMAAGITIMLAATGCQKDDTNFDEVIAEYEAQPDINIEWDNSALAEAPDEPVTDETDEFFNDYVENTNFSNTIAIDYNGNSVTVSGTVGGVMVETDGAHVTVTSAKGHVNYILSGSTTNGSFKIYSFNKYCITLNGVSITNPAGAAINSQSSKSCYIVLPEGTDNHLADGATYTEVELEDQKAALFSEGQIIFSGSGSLTVNATGKAGITSDDYIRFRPGPHINVTSTAGNGVKGKDAVFIDGGVLNITASASGAKGINSEGLVNVRGGRTTAITTGSTRIEGTDTTTCAALKVDSVLNISAGTLRLKATGEGGKGINCNQSITLSGGDVAVVATGIKEAGSPKGVKCDQNMTMTGGHLYSYSAWAAPLDVNGILTVASNRTRYETKKRSINILF